MNGELIDWTEDVYTEDGEALSKQTYYWRERLEQYMDSLQITCLVIFLILVDVGQLVAFELVLGYEGDAEPLTQKALTIIVLSLFVTELSLRQLAKGTRFWKDIWNIFDFLVVWASISMVVAKYCIEGFGLMDTDMSILADSDNSVNTRNTTNSGIYPNSENSVNFSSSSVGVQEGGLGGGNSGQIFTTDVATVNILRILSRVAVGMRVLRVLINLRRARKLSGHVTKALRTTVSQNRRRLVCLYVYIYIYICMIYVCVYLNWFMHP
jgi:hypothetical protein